MIIGRLLLLFFPARGAGAGPCGFPFLCPPPQHLGRTSLAIVSSASFLFPGRRNERKCAGSRRLPLPPNKPPLPSQITRLQADTNLLPPPGDFPSQLRAWGRGRTWPGCSRSPASSRTSGRSRRCVLSVFFFSLFTGSSRATGGAPLPFEEGGGIILDMFCHFPFRCLPFFLSPNPDRYSDLPPPRDDAEDGVFSLPFWSEKGVC